jgi:hypothetical protein
MTYKLLNTGDKVDRFNLSAGLRAGYYHTFYNHNGARPTPAERC